MSKHPRFYRPELDALRCFAFLLVFLHHAAPFQTGWLGDACVAGAFGVCVFFFLSAFLITELLTREKESTGTVQLRAFYIRRILRIWPLYFAALLVDFAHLHFTRPGAFSFARLAAFFLLAGNWFVAHHNFIGSLSLPLWSISIEEQFYVLWPSIRMRLSRMKSVSFALLPLVVAYGALAFECRRGADLETTVWVNSFVQFQFFASGAIVSLLLHGRAPNLNLWQRSLLFSAGSCALFCAQHIFHAKSGSVHPNFSLAGPGYLFVNAGCVLLFMSFLGASALGRVKPVIYLGKISYGLYVFHFAMLSVCNTALVRLSPTLGSQARVLRIPVALTCTVALASLSWRVFEAPPLRYKRRFEVLKTRPA